MDIKMKELKILFIPGTALQLGDAAIMLSAMGHDVTCYREPIEDIAENEEHEQAFDVYLRENRFDFVLTHIFTGIVARLTAKNGVKLAVYGMDSPMYRTWRKEIMEYDNCYLFYFDKRECQKLQALGYKRVYYLPLAANFLESSALVITDEEIDKYKCDISFVGGLYTKNIYDDCVKEFPVRFQELFAAIMERCAFCWDGKDRMEPFLTKEIIELIKRMCPEAAVDMEYYDTMPDAYYIRQWFFSRKLTNIERTLLLNLLAEQYDLHLYTREKEIVPPNIKRFPEVYFNEACKIYYSSKINLNITLRSIESGVPLRIFDIMSVGGFVLSNYQEEMTELFEEDKEIVLFRTPEEMIEKIDYYLAHEQERIRIGYNAYQKIKNCYTYEHQVTKILSVLFPGQ